MINDLFLDGMIPLIDWIGSSLDGLFPFIFYLFALGVPIYFLIMWYIKKKKVYAYIGGFTSIPMIVFLIWFYLAISALGS